MADKTVDVPAEEAPEYATIDVKYSVTIPKRYEPDLDSKGEPRKNKKRETIMRPLKFLVPVTVPQLSFEQWTDYWTTEGLDAEATFAHWINYLNKQKQESEKGSLRTIVVEAAQDMADTKSNKALLAKLQERPEIVTALADFQTAIDDNLVGKPVSTEKKQKEDRLAVANKVAEAAPELFRQLAAMTPDEIKSFLARAAEEGAAE